MGTASSFTKFVLVDKREDKREGLALGVRNEAKVENWVVKRWEGKRHPILGAATGKGRKTLYPRFQRCGAMTWLVGGRRDAFINQMFQCFGW